MATTYAPRALPPVDFHHLRDLIASRQLTFPDRLEEVARFALRHPEILAFESGEIIALKCGVSRTSVMRFAHYLGFTSFREMKALFQTRLRELSR